MKLNHLFPSAWNVGTTPAESWLLALIRSAPWVFNQEYISKNNRYLMIKRRRKKWMERYSIQQKRQTWVFDVWPGVRIGLVLRSIIFESILTWSPSFPFLIPFSFPSPLMAVVLLPVLWFIMLSLCIMDATWFWLMFWFWSW